MPLTDMKCRKAKPQGRNVRLYDLRGLYLEVSPSGGRWWRFKYRFAGREKRLSLGVYPEVDLKRARSRCDDARKLLAAGTDPSERRKAEKAAAAARADESTFQVVACDWYSKQAETWDPNHAKRVLSSLEHDVFPYIGARPINAIETPEIVTVMRRIEARGVRETAHRVLQRVAEIFRFAVASGTCERNPAADMVSVLAPRPKVKHFPAITEPKAFGVLLRSFDEYSGTLIVKSALKLAPMFGVRPGELRKAKWSAFDLEAGEWCFQASKDGPPLIVPLSRQALAILRDLHKLSGNSEYVFPGARSAKRPMSDNAILAALRRMEIPADVATGHGFRASFRTLGAEQLKFPVEWLEMQLGHRVKDPLGTAYNRTSFLPERRKMMQRWCNFCDRLKAGGEVIEIQKRA
ncbi:MAG: integrase arm-type DNA-binding domain-containing protein [Terracidiphilus sp.]